MKIMKNNQYIIDYNRNKTKLITIRLNKEKDKDIIEFLNYMENVNGYIKLLIRDQIKKIAGDALVLALIEEQNERNK